MFDKFSERHIGVSNEKDLKAMLDVIGVKSVDELISQVIPQSIRLRKPLALPAEGMSEYEFAAHIRELADRNQPYRSFIGMGYYPSAVPAVVTRNVFENPAWYTSYTPYQAEISQGRLEALLNFQTAVISLTGMEIGNCSLLDEGTAAAEAMAMMFSLRSRDAVREGRNQLFVDRNIFPQTLDVLLTRSEPFGIELIVDEYDEYSFTGKEFGDDQFDAEGFAAGEQHVERLREDVAVDEELVAALLDGFARAQGEHHQHRFGGGGGLVQQRAVADLHARERDHGGLEVQQRFEAALRNLGLIGRIGGVPRGILEDVARDGGGNRAGVVTHADERPQAAVALGQSADVACEFVLAHALRGQRERFLEPDGVRNDLRDQLVDRLDADRFEHGFKLLFVADADVAFGKFVEHIC